MSCNATPQPSNVSNSHQSNLATLTFCPISKCQLHGSYIWPRCAKIVFPSLPSVDPLPPFSWPASPPVPFVHPLQSPLAPVICKDWRNGQENSMRQPNHRPVITLSRATISLSSSRVVPSNARRTILRSVRRIVHNQPNLLLSSLGGVSPTLKLHLRMGRAGCTLFHQTHLALQIYRTFVLWCPNDIILAILCPYGDAKVLYV